MKIRTDFVTNSSSSSFILKDTNMSEIYKAFEDKKGEILKECWYDEKDYEQFYDRLKWINVTPIREHAFGDIEEVLGWYEDEIFAKIFEKGLNIEICFDEGFRRIKDETIEMLETKQFPDSVIEQIMSMIVIECIGNKGYYSFSTPSEIENRDKASEEELQNYLFEILSWERCCSDILIFVVTQYYEKIWSLIPKFINRPAGEIAEELFASLYGARYMYFDDMETHYVISDVIKESPLCVLGCNHMG